MCYQCEVNKGKPHICAEAQQFGRPCCGLYSKVCYSFREIAIEFRAQWGDNPPEPYLQAILNSSDMRLD